jgi:beta-aspartyl-peptidase (threonine type)
MQTYTIAIHGGAGTITPEDLTPELEESYIKGLEGALNAGFAVLEQVEHPSMLLKQQW